MTAFITFVRNLPAWQRWLPATIVISLWLTIWWRA